MLLMLTTQPFAFSSSGSSAWVSKNGESRLTSRVVRQFCRVRLSELPKIWMAALFTNVSNPHPCRCWWMRLNDIGRVHLIACKSLQVGLYVARKLRAVGLSASVGRDDVIVRFVEHVRNSAPDTSGRTGY